MIGLSWARKVLIDRSGASAITLAVVLPALVGTAGLGTEVAGWCVTQRTMQGAADTAAFSAMTALIAGATSTQLTTQAKSVAASNNFVDGSKEVTVSVNNPPTSGNYVNNSDAIEVIISQPQTPLLSALFISSGPTISARSVALTNAVGSGCVLALDHGDVTDFLDNGNTTINLNGCSLYVDSSSDSALTMHGGATINATAVYITGGASIPNNATLNATNGVFTGVNPAPDPYINVAVPSFAGCDQNGFSLTAGGSQEISPNASGIYVFCNGIDLKGGASLTLDPGIYIIDRGVLTLEGNSTLTATGGVTIVLTSSTGNNYATASIASNATVSITAPNSGPTKGLAIFQDRNAPSSGGDDLKGGATQSIVGAIYFPNQNVNFVGGSSTGGSQCTQLIALTISFKGNSSFNTSCNSVGIGTIGLQATRLVE